MKKTFIIIAVIIAAIGLAVSLGALIAVNFDFTKLGNAKYETNEYSVSENFNSIEIDAKETDVIIKPSDNGGVSAVCVGRENVKHTVSVENGTLKITLNDERKWFDRLEFFLKPLSITLYLNASQYDALKVSSSTGDVSVDGAFTFGNVNITASTGDIEIKNIVAAKLDLTVSTGDIRVSTVNCEGDVSVSISTGETIFTDLTCKNLISTGSMGDVTLKNVVAAESFSIERSTGDVRFDNSDAVNITVKTSTGSVKGTLRTAKVFNTKTSTGSVSVPDTASGGNCNITTNTGSIKIELSAE